MIKLPQFSHVEQRGFKIPACADPVLGQYIKKLESVTLAPNNRITLFEALVKSVIGQQLSGKAAHSISLN